MKKSTPDILCSVICDLLVIITSHRLLFLSTRERIGLPCRNPGRLSLWNNSDAARALERTSDPTYFIFLQCQIRSKIFFSDAGIRQGGHTLADKPHILHGIECLGIESLDSVQKGSDIVPLDDGNNHLHRTGDTLRVDDGQPISRGPQLFSCEDTALSLR